MHIARVWMASRCQAAWATKKYQGHRVIPEDILIQLERAKLQ